MRLRLRIERNALPPTQALWPVKDTKSTIAQLLQSINEVFPLEADTWGLEDYAVSIDGYECLHWYELRAVCKDEDEVVIKPLQYVEVRSRTLTGRDQIASDGRHLLDGVPFGKPQLKAPVRPDISIPPRKKRRLNFRQEADDEEQAEAGAPLMLTENGEDVDDEADDDDDEDFEEGASASDASSSDSEDSFSDSSDDDSSDSDSESESDSARESNDDETWDGLSSNGPATPSRKTDISLTPKGSAERSRNQQSDVQAELDRINREISELEAAHDKEHERRQQSDDKKRKRQERKTLVQHIVEATNKKANQAGEATASLVTQGKPVERPPQVAVAPFEGRSETKKRNERRRNSKKLKHLIRIGDLPEDATIASVRELENRNTAWSNGDTIVNTTNREASSSSKGGGKKVILDPELEAERQKLLSDIASGGVDVTSDPPKKKTKRKSHSTTDTANTLGLSKCHSEDNEPPSEEDTSELPPPPLYHGLINSSNSVDATADKDSEMPAPSTTPRTRLNLDASKRLVFGSLGVRTPKTQEEKEQLQKKLADRATRHVQSTSLEPSEVNETAQVSGQPEDQAADDSDDDESWRSKINLTAVECCDENVSLSTPPFPFHQRWDPQYKKKKAKKRVNGSYMESGGSKRKRGKQNQDFIETYDKYNINGDGDALEYDDADEDEDEEFWEEGALLNGASGSDDEADKESSSSRFPPLPQKLEHLSTLTASDANQGDFIAFTELACDESTSWQPKEITRLVQVLGISTDGSCWMQPRPQDIKRKVYDDDGNRVYAKFEMPDDDDEADEDDGTRSMQWKDMGVVRLVLRPEEVTKSLNLNGA